MTSLNDAEMFAILEASPILDEVEAALRLQGRGALADGLGKLQQDIGIDIVGGPGGEACHPPPGLQTARLVHDYEPVTRVRLSVFPIVDNALEDGALKQRFAAMLGNLNIHQSSARAVIPVIPVVGNITPA